MMKYRNPLAPIMRAQDFASLLPSKLVTHRGSSGVIEEEMAGEQERPAAAGDTAAKQGACRCLLRRPALLVAGVLHAHAPLV